MEKVHQRVHPEDLAMILEVVGQAVKEERAENSNIGFSYRIGLGHICVR